MLSGFSKVIVRNFALVSGMIAMLGAGFLQAETQMKNIYVSESFENHIPGYRNQVFDLVSAYARKINEQGGILKHQLKVIYQDGKKNGKSNTERLTDHAQVAVNDPDHFFTLSVSNSDFTLIEGKIYQDKKKLYFPVYATTPKIKELGPTVFQICANDNVQGRVIAKYFFENHKQAKKAFVLRNQSLVYSKGLADAFIQSAKEHRPGIQLTIHDYINGFLQVEKIVHKIASVTPDVVFIPDLQFNSAMVTRQLVKQKLGHIPVLGGDGWEAGVDSMDIFYGENPPKNLNYLYTNHWHEDIQFKKSKEYQDLIKKLTGRRAHGLTVFSFEAMKRTLNLAEQIGSFDPLKIAERLRGSEYLGSTGKVTLNSKGESERSLAIMRVTSDRKPKLEELAKY